MTEIETTGGNVVAAPMPRARFAALIETYGAAPERWPEAERAAARALIERGSDAREALAEAALLDRVLDSAQAPTPSADLVRELARRFERRGFRLPWRAPTAAWPLRSGAALAGAAALVLVAFGIGRWTLDPGSGPAPVRVLAAIETGDGALIGDDEPLELEIALIDSAIDSAIESAIDPAIAGFDGEESLDEPSGPLGLTVASAPLMDDLPLD